MHTPFYIHTHKFKPHPFTSDTAIGGHISTLQTHIHISNMATLPCVCASANSHKNIHTHRQVHTDYTHRESKNNSYKDKCLCSSLLSSLSDSTQRHELNLGCQPITPSAREGKRFGPPTGESVCFWTHPYQCMSCQSTLGFHSPQITGSELCVDLLSQVKLLFTLIDSQYAVYISSYFLYEHSSILFEFSAR